MNQITTTRGNHMLDDTAGAARFDHPKNIEIGKGRIIWAPSTVDTSGNYHLEGWALPGGRRTGSETEARATAVRIDGLCAQGVRQ